MQGQSHAKPRFDIAIWSIKWRHFMGQRASRGWSAWRRVQAIFNMADKGGQFTEAEKKQMEMLNAQFTLRQKYMAKIKRRNLAVFACLLASVGGICILCLKQAERERWLAEVCDRACRPEKRKERVVSCAKSPSLMPARPSQLSLWQRESLNEICYPISCCFIKYLVSPGSLCSEDWTVVQPHVFQSVWRGYLICTCN